MLRLKTLWRVGTSHFVMSPLQLQQHRVALVPRLRLPLIRFDGVLTPHATLRAAIVPSAALQLRRSR